MLIILKDLRGIEGSFSPHEVNKTKHDVANSESSFFIRPVYPQAIKWANECDLTKANFDSSI